MNFVQVAGSYDSFGFKYKTVYSAQEPHLEMIVRMEVMVKQLLLYFKEQNGGTFPSKIYYRDGVSDGQFAEVPILKT